MARLFAESFANEGLKVWWDAVLHSGETFDEVIERNLRAAKAVVVLWSPKSVTSRWVRAEATQADRANKLVPVIIEPCVLPIIFELTHTTDLSGWEGDRFDHRWQSLIHDLRRLVGPAQEVTPAPITKPGPVKDEQPPEAATAAEPAESQKPAKQAPKPANQDEIKTEDELIEALQRLAKKKASALQTPTPAENANAEFFERSDAYREKESEVVHCLRRIYGSDSEPYYVVSPPGLRIGRTAPADIVVSEPSVSREHCVVEMAAGKLRVADLNSTNGTYIDNKRLGRAEILPVGSVLRVGNVSFEHVIQSRENLEQATGIDGLASPSTREPRIARS